MRRSPRWLRLLLAQAVLVQLVTLVLRPMTSYRALELGISPTGLGILSTCFAVVPLLVAVPVGAATDSRGKRPVLVAGGLFVFFAALTFVLAGGSMAGLVLGSVLLGTGHLLSVVAEQSMVAEAAAEEGFDVAFARFTFATSTGQLLGPALIAAFGGAATLPATGRIFGIALALATVFLAMTFFVSAPEAVTAAARRSDERGDVRGLLGLAGLRTAVGVSCLVRASLDMIIVYLPAVGAAHHLPSNQVGLLLMVNSAGAMVSRSGLGKLVARVGRRRLLAGGLLGAATFLLVVPLEVSLLLVGVAVLSVGVTLGVSQPLTMSWIAEIAPPEQRATALSLRITGNRLGQTAIPAAVGIVAGGSGPAGVLWTTAALLYCAGGAVLRSRGLKTRSPAGSAAAPADRSTAQG